MPQVRFRVEFVKSAKREWEGLAPRLQDKILEALGLLAANPFSELLKIKKLKGADDLYRVRLGDYRLIYEIRREAALLIVIRIGHRNDVYRRL